MSEKIVQTAGRKQLGDFAPVFAYLNDDVLFGEVWNEEAIDVKRKYMILPKWIMHILRSFMMKPEKRNSLWI